MPYEVKAAVKKYNIVIFTKMFEAFLKKTIKRSENKPNRIGAITPEITMKIPKSYTVVY